MKKVAVVTGGNRGIGFAIVQGLCEVQFPGYVYLTSRDPDKGQAAVSLLKSIGLQAQYHQLDVTDEKSIERFKHHLQTTHGGLDVLVNNAAVIFQKDSKESLAEQATRTIKVNFEGPVNVCTALWPLLRDGARVVHMCSTAGHLSRICGYEPHAATLRAHFSSPMLDIAHLQRLLREYLQAVDLGQYRQLGWPNSSYAVSKVGIAALTRIQQRDIDSQGRNIIVNCVYPGNVKTDLNRNTGSLTPQKGALLPIQLCLLPQDTVSPRGEFVWCDGSVLDWTSGSTPRRTKLYPHDTVCLEWTRHQQ